MSFSANPLQERGAKAASATDARTGTRLIDPGDTIVGLVQWNPTDPDLFAVRLQYSKAEDQNAVTTIDLQTGLSYQDWKDKSFWLHGTADVPSIQSQSEVLYLNYSLHVEVAEINGVSSVRVSGEISPRWIIGDLVIDISEDGPAR